MLETIIYNAIKSKLKSQNYEDVDTIMSGYMQDFCNQFSLRILQELDLTNPDIETLVFYLMYQVEEQKQHHIDSVNRICSDLKDQQINSIITSSDIVDIINKNK